MSGALDLYSFITGDLDNARRFEEFLEAQGWSHQYDFVCVVQGLQSNFDLQPLNLGRAVRDIHRTYLNLVSVSERVKLTLDNKITFQEFSTDIFDDAAKEVWEFLSSVVYRQFLNSHNPTDVNCQYSNGADSGQVSTQNQSANSSPPHLQIDGQKETQNRNNSTSTRCDQVTLQIRPDSNCDRPESNCSSQVKNNNNNCHNGLRPEEGHTFNPVVSDMDSLSLSTKPSPRSSSLMDGPMVVTRKYLINRDRDSLPEKKPPPRQSPMEHQKLPVDFGRKLEDMHMQGKREFVKGCNRTLKEKNGDKFQLDEPDNILDEHVKIVWAGDVTPEKSTSPSTRREYKRRDGSSHPCSCQITKTQREHQEGLSRSRTFPTPSNSKCDPDSGISVVSMSTSTSTSFKSQSEDKMGYTSKWLHNNNKFSVPSVPPSVKWRRDKMDIPVVVHCHGNPVPFYFVIPRKSAETTVTLKMFKDFLPMKDNFRFLFQFNGRKGIGIEEIFEDASQIPIFNGQIVARIRPFF